VSVTATPLEGAGWHWYSLRPNPSKSGHGRWQQLEKNAQAFATCFATLATLSLLRSDPSPMCKRKSSARDHGDSVAAHFHWRCDDVSAIMRRCEQIPCDALVPILRVLREDGILIPRLESNVSIRIPWVFRCSSCVLLPRAHTAHHYTGIHSSYPSRSANLLQTHPSTRYHQPH
jgi:hypothetical protein